MRCSTGSSDLPLDVVTWENIDKAGRSVDDLAFPDCCNDSLCRLRGSTRTFQQMMAEIVCEILTWLLIKYRALPRMASSSAFVLPAPSSILLLA